MGKKFYYITSEGKEVAKAEFDASNGAKVEVNPKAGSWELIMTCIPTEDMLDAVESRLASWLKTRRNMAAPFEEGSRVRIDGAQPDSFKLNLPQSSISKKQTEEIGQAWLDWRKKFNTSAPQTTQQQTDTAAVAAAARSSSHSSSHSSRLHSSRHSSSHSSSRQQQQQTQQQTQQQQTQQQQTQQQTTQQQTQQQQTTQQQHSAAAARKD